MTKDVPKAYLPAATIREISVAASVHPASIEKALRGGVPRGLAGHRLRAELQRRGLEHLAPALFAAILGCVPERAGALGEDE